MVDWISYPAAAWLAPGERHDRAGAGNEMGKVGNGESSKITCDISEVGELLGESAGMGWLDAHRDITSNKQQKMVREEKHQQIINTWKDQQHICLHGSIPSYLQRSMVMYPEKL